MPLYEYQCDACGGRLERIQKFSDPPLTDCPTCGGALTKLLSSPAIQFKGTGWYITDYARKSESASSGSAGDGSGKDGKDRKSDAAASSSSSESTTAADTAPAAAAPAKADKS